MTDHEDNNDNFAPWTLEGAAGLQAAAAEDAEVLYLRHDAFGG